MNLYARLVLDESNEAWRATVMGIIADFVPPDRRLVAQMRVGQAVAELLAMRSKLPPPQRE